MGTSHCTPWKINMEPEKSPVWKRKITFQTFIFTFHVYFHWYVPSIAHVFFSKEASCFPPFFERRHPIEVMNSTWAFAKLTYADSELMVRCPGNLDESCNPTGSKCRGQLFFFFQGKKNWPLKPSSLANPSNLFKNTSQNRVFVEKMSCFGCNVCHPQLKTSGPLGFPNRRRCSRWRPSMRTYGSWLLLWLGRNR